VIVIFTEMFTIIIFSNNFNQNFTQEISNKLLQLNYPDILYKLSFSVISNVHLDFLFLLSINMQGS
jgi:hypothetical protein